MSVRVYSGRYVLDRRGPSPAVVGIPVALAVATVAAQIAWPLTSGSTRAALTAATVMLFLAASASHAAIHRGVGWMLQWLVASVGIGLLAEVVGIRTGFPFGQYTYSDALGPNVFGVPIVVAAAWAMMSYPALLAGRRLAGGTLLVPVVAALALATWDLFLDPQMVGESYWTWAHPSPALPGIPGIPLTNFAGWLLVALVLMAVLDRLPEREGAAEGVPAVLYAWTWLGGIVANLFFFDRPGAAVWGGVAMGAFAVPYAWSVWSTRP